VRRTLAAIPLTLLLALTACSGTSTATTATTATPTASATQTDNTAATSDAPVASKSIEDAKQRARVNLHMSCPDVAPKRSLNDNANGYDYVVCNGVEDNTEVMIVDSTDLPGTEATLKDVLADMKLDSHIDEDHNLLYMYTGGQTTLLGMMLEQ